MSEKHGDKAPEKHEGQAAGGVKGHDMSDPKQARLPSEHTASAQNEHNVKALHPDAAKLYPENKKTEDNKPLSFEESQKLLEAGLPKALAEMAKQVGELAVGKDDNKNSPTGQMIEQLLKTFDEVQKKGAGSDTGGFIPEQMLKEIHERQKIIDGVKPPNTVDSTKEGGLAVKDKDGHVTDVYHPPIPPGKSDHFQYDKNGDVTGYTDENGKHWHRGSKDSKDWLETDANGFPLLPGGTMKGDVEKDKDGIPHVVDKHERPPHDWPNEWDSKPPWPEKFDPTQNHPQPRDDGYYGGGGDKAGIQTPPGAQNDAQERSLSAPNDAHESRALSPEQEKAKVAQIEAILHGLTPDAAALREALKGLSKEEVQRIIKKVNQDVPGSSLGTDAKGNAYYGGFTTPMGNVGGTPIYP